MAGPGDPESIEVTAEAPGDILLGDTATIRLTARNTGGADEYNLSFRYVLPEGVSYESGSSPVSIGEPRQVTGPAGETVLLWVNVSDLPINSEQTVVFKVTADTVELPIGSTFETSATAYANSDERTVPKFDNEGTYTGGATVQSDAEQQATTISAIKVDKAEPSPEHELRRGVHSHPTVYTLTVTNNSYHDDDDVVLVDYVPAQLEFLGCGDVDNTAAGDVEYTGAPRLDAIADLKTDCPAPVTVTTVEDPAGYPAGIYTRVEWQLGTLSPGEVVDVRYAAGIPQRANTMDFGGKTPSGESLEQAANLDNNTAGSPTRETGSEQALTNYTEVRADFTGPVAPGTSPQVSDTDQLVVTSEDLAIQKSVTPDTFMHGGRATYTLQLQTGEYAEAENIVITDVLPDGLCPLGAGLAECPDGDAPSVPFTSVTQDAEGGYTVVFDPFMRKANDELTITYQAQMLDTYDETGAPTVAGDGFTNNVSLTSQTTTLAEVEAPDPGTVTVIDTSSARIVGNTAALDKRILPNTGPTPYECTDETNDYLDPQAGNEQDYTFGEGSRVCFLLEVAFPKEVDTKNPELTDFLPDNLVFEDGRALPSNEVAFVTDGAAEDLRFLLGTEQDGDRFVVKGSVFQYVVSTTVDSAAQPAQVDVAGNLLKLRWTNTEGQVSFLRDGVDLQVPPAPPVTVDKQASQEEVKAGDDVDFTVTVGNGGTAEYGNAIDIVGPDVWDRLPVGIDCADVSAISGPGACTDPGATGHPSFDGNDQRSAIRWDLPDTVTIVPGATVELTYQVTYPATVAADATYANDVDVASYGSETNIDTVAQHYPANNVDTTVDPGEIDAPAAHDDETVDTPITAIAKINDTEVDDASQAANPGATNYVAIGETVTYTVTATLPADTTIYKGVVYDAPPSRIRVDSVTYEFSTDAGAIWSTTTPAGWSTESDEARVTLATPYEVDGTADLVRMTITSTATASGTTPAHNATLRNTAHVTSTNELGAQPTDRTATSTVTAVHPNPSPLKQASDTEPGATDTVTYTVTARNANPNNASEMRPVLHETVLVDCVPDGLTVETGSVLVSDGAATIGAVGTNGCAAGTPIVWDVGDLAWRAPAALGTTPWPVMTYDVVIDPDAGGGARYTNTVTETGTSMNGEDVDERTYVGTTSEKVTVPGGGLAKSVTPVRAPVGDTVTYTVTAQVPARVNLYDATVIDQLPTGILTSSVELGSVTWSYTDGGVGEPTGLPTANPLTASGGKHGWFLGDIQSDNRPRKVTIVYNAVVTADEDTNDAGRARTNFAQLAWNSTNEVTGDVTDPDTLFDQNTPDAPATTTVQEPDLSIDKVVDNATPKPGETFRYTVTVTNASGADASTAHDVDLTDDVPAGVRVLPGTISNGGVLDDANPDGGNGSITWADLGPLTPGESVALSYDAQLVSLAPDSPQVNTAEITEYTSLPDGGGRVYEGPEDSATVTPALPELHIDKSLLDAAPAYRGTPVRWQLEVTNIGEATAYDVDVSDLLPEFWTYDVDSARVSFAGNPATAVEPTVAARTLTWTDLGDLADGDSILIVFTATPGDDAPVGSAADHVNEAATSGKEGEDGAVITTDEDTAETRIDSADLQIVKEAQGTPVAGAEFSWKLIATNNGGDSAVGPFTLTDTLPEGLTGVGATGTGWTIGIDPGGTGVPATVTATRTGSLAAAAGLPPLTITATVPDDLAPGTGIVNTGSVEAKTHDPDGSNNTDPETSQVTTISDFGITKVLNGDVVPGGAVTYGVDVTNHGPSQARGPITVTDTLPVGLTYDSFTGSGWTLDSADGQELTFLWDGATPVLLGAMPQITIRAEVDSSLTEDVTNTVTVEEATDPTTGPEEPDTDTVTSTPVPSADLAISKDHVGEFEAGRQGTYQFAVTNNGSSDAAGPVTITDALPDSLSYVSVDSADGWTCETVGQDLTCELPGGLTAQQGTTLDIVVDIDEALTGDVENSATVSSSTPDPHEPNNSADDDTGIDVKVDLSIEKALVTAPVVAGEKASFELTVTNNGPATSPAPITVSDTLPKGLQFVSATGSGWNCTNDGQGIECERAATLNSGVTAPVITVVAAVDSGIGAVQLENVASVSGPAVDPTPGNNTDREPVPATEDTEIVVTKTTTGADPVRAGESATFEITVENTGSSDARNVVVNDTLPAGMSLVSISGEGWDCADDTCARDRIVAGATAPALTVVAGVAAGTPDGDTLVNRAEGSTGTPGDDPKNNTDEDGVKVVAEADLALTKTHVGEAVAGTPTSFKSIVTNDGPSDAVGPLTVIDQLPAGMSYLSAAAPWTCTPGGGGTVKCTLPDGLMTGQSAPPLVVQVQLADSLDSGPITNTAEVGSPTTDPAPGNNADDEEISVERLADVSVVKSHTGKVRIGDPLTFTLKVRNDGPSEARDVTVIDTLPAGLDFVSADGQGWSCELVDVEVRCAVDESLAPNSAAAPITLTTTVRPAAYPKVVNVTEVKTSSPDPEKKNNTTTDPVEVPAQVDLAIEKSAAGELVVGETGSYKLVVTNKGPTAAPGPVTVFDLLPEGLTFAGTEGDGWTCASEERTVTCTREDPLAAESTSSIVLTVGVEPGAYPEVVNTAKVNSPSEDTNPENNGDDVTSPVTPTVELGIEKTVQSKQERQVTYLIEVTNRGPSDTVEPVVVRDELPGSLELIRANGSGWSCETGDWGAVCSYADALPAGDSTELTVVTTIVGDPQGTVVNEAAVEGGGDPEVRASKASIDPDLTKPDGNHLATTGGPPLAALLVSFLLLLTGTWAVRRSRARR